MNITLFRRGVSLMAALSLSATLALSAGAASSDGLCQHHPSHTTDCGYEATGECTHECTAASGCVTVRCSHEHVATCFDGQDASLCTHVCTDTPACYTPVIECVHTQHGSCGHSEGKDCSIALNGCSLCKAVELKGTDVVLTDGTEYLYTGQEIKPHVTVMVDRTILVESEHYTVTYANNIGAGTGTVTVTGIPEAGYTGSVTIPFTIATAPGTPEFSLVEIKGTDVIIDGTEFSYTGEAIEPGITVTVNGTVLTEGRDYTVSYVNNTEPGTATVTVRGIATASQTLGYTGEVSIDFTIVKADNPENPSEPEEETKPENPSEPEDETKPENPSEPEEETKPENPSEPEDETKPENPSEPEEETKPENPSEPEDETKPEAPDYKFTKGSGSKWYRSSGKNLVFTINADTADITAIRIDGKKLGSSHYTLDTKGNIILKSSYLESLAQGTYRVTAEFADGSTSATFTVGAAADTSIPQTGDSSHVGLWIALMLGSLSALAGVVFVLRRRIAA